MNAPGKDEAMTTSTPWFSKEKREELSSGYRDLIAGALDAGDIENARAWIDRSHEMRYIVHDNFVQAMSIFFSYLYRRFGEDEAINAMREALMGFVPKWASIKKDLTDAQGVVAGTRAWVEFVADTWRKHYGSFTVDEDDEKIIFTHNPCGSGGRLMNAELSGGPVGYEMIRRAGPWTWGEENVPIYCVHCCWAHEIIPVSIAGPGAQFWIHATPFPRKPGDPCVHYIYKNPEDIPERYYQRIGLDKSKTDAAKQKE
jgi:hypothetical protein